MKVTHKPLREIAVSSSLQNVSFLSSSSEWAIVEDSVSLVVSDKKQTLESEGSKIKGGFTQSMKQVKSCAF